MVVIATMAMMACGGASGSDPTEAGLRTSADSLANAQSDGKWAEWYKLFSPDNKLACSEADFSAAMDLNMSLFRESERLEDSDKLEFRVREVTVQGTQGLAIVDIYSDGEFVDSIDENWVNWVFADGNWWTGVPECSNTVPGAFDAADMRALLSDEEVEAAIPLVIARKLPMVDMRGLAGAEGNVGKDSIWAHLFPSAAGGELMVLVTDYESPEILQQRIVMWTVRDSMESTGSTIGDGSLQAQEGDTVSVRLWKGDKTVLLRATDLPGTQEVLDGLIALAELAESRLSSN